MSQHRTPDARPDGVLTALRRLVPQRELDYEESLRIAELQANRLLRIWQIDEWPVQQEVVTELPRIVIQREPGLPVSGSAHWSGTHWIITLNADEPWTRQRFTLLHEFKHILDHGHTDQLYRDDGEQTASEQAERAADYFAGCALVPTRLLKRAWLNRLQRPVEVAEAFEVSVRAIEVRHLQTGLTEPAATPAPTKKPSRKRHLRQLKLLRPSRPSMGRAT